MKNNKKLIVVLLLTVFLITVLASASACTSKKEYKISLGIRKERSDGIASQRSGEGERHYFGLSSREAGKAVAKK